MLDAPPITLPTFWYNRTDRANPERPGLYEWRIEGRGSYIGQYRWISRPEREYGLNVRRLLSHMPYRKAKPYGYRRIHWELATAVVARLRIDLIILENADKPAINDREQKLIRERGNLNTPPFGRRTTAGSSGLGEIAT